MTTFLHKVVNVQGFGSNKRSATLGWSACALQ